MLLGTYIGYGYIGALEIVYDVSPVSSIRRFLAGPSGRFESSAARRLAPVEVPLI